MRKIIKVQNNLSACPLPMGKGVAKSFFGGDDCWIEAVSLIPRGVAVKHRANECASIWVLKPWCAMKVKAGLSR